MKFKTPTYTDIHDNKVNILISQIMIWDPEKFKDGVPKENECITLYEVANIDVNQNYRELISTAVVRFPRGTMLRKIETAYVANPKTEASDQDVVQPGSKEKGKDSTKSTASGKEQPIFTTISELGVVQVQRSKAEKELEAADLKVGNRIQIKVGYTDNPLYADEFPTKENPTGEFNGYSSDNRNNKFILLFTGYITKVSATTPIELQCEDMLSCLKKVGVPRISLKNAKVNDLVLKGSKFDLLKNTPIKVHPNVEKSNITLGNIELTKELVVADVLAKWVDSGIFCFMRREGALNQPQLCIGKTYFSDDSKPEESVDKIVSIMNREAGIEPVKIQMDWDVANDNLNIINVDPKFIAVRASAPNGKKNGFINLTVIPDDEDKKQYRVVNIHETGRKEDKTKGGNSNAKKKKKKEKKIINKVDLSQYTVIPYMGTSKKQYTKEELAQAAWTYYGQKKYNTTGINGNLTVFGDLDIQPTDIVSIVDKRQPVRQGFYMVGEVHTTFGTSGYRKEITLPFKIAKFTSEPEFEQYLGNGK